MKVRPILFSWAMVRAILEGRKTQTRRVVRPPLGFKFIADAVGGPYWRVQELRKECGEWYESGSSPYLPDDADQQRWIRSLGAYGEPGDGLWVRETWAPNSQAGVFSYAADWAEGVKHVSRWRPSIHMPRTACRISLEVVGVRVERLQEISEGDAVAEGCDVFRRGDELPVFRDYSQAGLHYGLSAVGSYRTLWEKINGAGSWAVNPWVWVVEFRRVGADLTDLTDRIDGEGLVA